MTTYSQGYSLKTKDTTYVFNYEPSIKFILDEFFEGCRKYDIPLDRFIDLDGIYIVPNFKPFGSTFFRKGKDVILITNDIPIYLPTFMSAIIYHELYHFISENRYHCIIRPYNFSSYIEEFLRGYPECLYLLQDGSNINIEKIIREWNEDAKKEYFLFLKNIK